MKTIQRLLFLLLIELAYLVPASANVYYTNNDSNTDVEVVVRVTYRRDEWRENNWWEGTITNSNVWYETYWLSGFDTLWLDDEYCYSSDGYSGSEEWLTYEVAWTTTHANGNDDTGGTGNGTDPSWSWANDDFTIANQWAEFFGIQNNGLEWWQVPGTEFGQSSAAHEYRLNPSAKNGDKVLWKGVQDGLVKAETRVHGPFTQAQAQKINDRLRGQEKIAQGVINLLSSIGITLTTRNPAAGVLAGEAADQIFDLPQRREITAGDIIIVTVATIHMGPGRMAIGSTIEVRIINRNFEFRNDTGLTEFNGTPAQVIWEATSQHDAPPENAGTRLYMGPDGKIRFELLPPR